MNLRPLTAGTAYLLGSLERSPAPPKYIEDVETFVFEVAQRQVIRTGGEVLLVEDQGVPIGAVVHEPHTTYRSTQLIPALLIDHRHRGSGHGPQALRMTIDHVLVTTNVDHIVWLVHQNNDPMVGVSRMITGEPPLDNGDGFLVFIIDR